MKKGSKTYSVLAHKCPRCQTGNLYYTSTLSFRRPFDMPDNCPHCNQRYSLEAGFYYGAMFVSYIMTAFLMFSMFAVCKFLLGLDIFPSFVLVTIIVFSLYVWIFRTSRAIWINFFVKFDKKYV